MDFRQFQASLVYYRVPGQPALFFYMSLSFKNKTNTNQQNNQNPAFLGKNSTKEIAPVKFLPLVFQLLTVRQW